MYIMEQNEEIIFSSPTVIIFMIVFFLVILILALLLFSLKLYFKTKSSSVQISVYEIILMKIRKVKPEIIIPVLIAIKDAEIKVSLDELEAFYLEGGEVYKLKEALIYAKERNVALSFKEAAAYCLENKDIKHYIDSKID